MHLTSACIAYPLIHVFHVTQTIYKCSIYLLYLYCRRKTRGMSFKPNVSTEEEKVKTSPNIPHVRQKQSRVVYKEIELIPRPAINISPGRVQHCTFVLQPSSFQMSWLFVYINEPRYLQKLMDVCGTFEQFYCM